MKTSFEKQFEETINGQKRLALLNAITADPELTVGELINMLDGEFGPLLSDIRFGELVPAARPSKKPKSKAEKPVKAKPAKAKGPAKTKVKAVDTRSPEGRAAYDEAVYGALNAAGEPTGAGAVIAAIGGTSMQVRSAFARLIEAGRITWEGQARATKYTIL